MDNVYEYDNSTPSQMRDVLEWVNLPENDVTVSRVVMALCKQVAELQSEVQQLRRCLAQVVQMPLEK